MTSHFFFCCKQVHIPFLVMVFKLDYSVEYRTRIVTSVNDNSCEVCETLRLASYSNSEKYPALLFSERSTRHIYHPANNHL